MKTKLKINEAIAFAVLNGKSVTKNDIMNALWPNSSMPSKRTNMSGLMTGRTARVAPEWIGIICDLTGVTADFLLGR